MTLLNKKEAAEYLSTCTDTLMAEYHAGRLIGFKIGGRWRFDTRDLDRYIDEKRQESALAARVKAEGTARGKVVRIPGTANGPPIDQWWTPGKKIADVCAENARKAAAKGLSRG